MAEKKEATEEPASDSNEKAVAHGTMEIESMSDAKPVNARHLSEPLVVGESEETITEEEETDEKRADEEETTAVEEEPAKKKKKVNRAMEYDLKHMYPEMNVLTDKKRNEWDYQDPKTIRALWLETQTNVLAEWKIKYTRIKRTRKPQFEVRDTAAQFLRDEYVKNQLNKLKEAETKNTSIIESRGPPKFDEVKLPTNTTTDMRYRYNRNNPPVPLYYLEHFDKHKKPPFKLHGINNEGCRTLKSNL